MIVEIREAGIRSLCGIARELNRRGLRKSRRELDASTSCEPSRPGAACASARVKKHALPASRVLYCPRTQILQISRLGRFPDSADFSNR